MLHNFHENVKVKAPFELENKKTFVLNIGLDLCLAFIYTGYLAFLFQVKIINLHIQNHMLQYEFH